MRLKVEVLSVNLESPDLGHDHPTKSAHEILTGVEVKVKTKWAYAPLPAPMTLKSTPMTLPSYVPLSRDEPLVLFIEVWKCGHFQGLSEFNIRELLGKEPGEDVLKWLQIWCPITNKIKGKLMLRLEDEEREAVTQPVQLLEPTRLPRPSTASDAESASKRRPSTPMSSYFPPPASGSPMTSMSSSASTVTVLTAQSSPSKGRRSSPELDELDIIQILNNKLELLSGSYQESRGNSSKVTQRSPPKGPPKSGTISKPPPTPSTGAVNRPGATFGRSTNTFAGRSSEAIVAVVKVKDSAGQGQLPKKRRMAANFTNSPQPTNQKTSKGSSTK